MRVLAGVMLAVLQVYRPVLFQRLQRRSAPMLIVGLALVGLAMLLFANRTGLLANAIGWPVLSLGLGLLVLAATDPVGLLGRWAIPGAAWLAAISYSLYLSHKMAIHLVHDRVVPLLPPGVPGLGLFAIYAMAVWVLGAALYYVVERPFLRWRDRHGVGRSGARLSMGA